MFHIGIDVGGTKIEGAIFKETDGDLLPFGSSFRLPTERHLGYAHIIHQICEVTQHILLESKMSLEDLSGIGLGLPGTVNPLSQKMVKGNTIALEDAPLMEDLAIRFSGFHGVLRCENDANCFALAESQQGAGVLHEKLTGVSRKKHIAVGIILGTGCGGGMVLKNELVSGENGGACEVGHSILYSQGHPCYCGRRGCAEQYVSGSALEASFQSRRTGFHKGSFHAEDIFELATQGDPTAQGVVKIYKLDLATFLGNIATILNPSYFVLGGGISNRKEIYENLEMNCRTHSFLSHIKVPVYSNQIGDSAGTLGAALLCRQGSPVRASFE